MEQKSVFLFLSRPERLFHVYVKYAWYAQMLGVINIQRGGVFLFSSSVSSHAKRKKKGAAKTLQMLACGSFPVFTCWDWFSEKIQQQGRRERDLRKHNVKVLEIQKGEADSWECTLCSLDANLNLSLDRDMPDLWPFFLLQHPLWTNNQKWPQASLLVSFLLMCRHPEPVRS